MKKKFIAVSVLICALALGSTTLTSCVDDNESASVTAIRDAKAKQLTSLANLQQAQADAEKIIAEAEAAIRNAAAQAAQIENESASVELEIKKATLATDIEAAKAKAEATLIQNKVALEKAKAELIQAADQADAATKIKINNLLAAANAIMNGGTYNVMNLLYDDYTPNYGTTAPEAWTEIEITVSQSINGYQEESGNVGDPDYKAEEKGLSLQLVDLKAEKTKAEYELEDVKLKIAEAVRQKQIDLASQEALLAEYQKYTNTDKEAAQKAANEALAKVQPLRKTYDEAFVLYRQELNKITNAVTNVNATEIEKFFAQAVNNSKYGENGSVVKAIKREVPTGETIIIKYDDGTIAETTPWYGYANGKIEVNANAIDKAITSAEREVEIKKADVANAKKNETDGKKDDAMVVIWSEDETPVELYNDTYKALKDAIKAAQEAYDEDKTSSNKSILETYENYKEIYEQGLADAVADAEGEQTTAEEDLKELNDLKTLLTGDAFKAYTTVYDAFIDTVDASEEAWVASKKAYHNYDVQNSLAIALQNVANGYTDWANLISNQEQAINQTKKDIAGMTSNGTSDPSSVQDNPSTPSDESRPEGFTEAQKQAYIASLDAEIARIEKEISIKQAQYDSYMSQVEALINGEETPEVPETPEEGGEETPAE